LRTEEEQEMKDQSGKSNRPVYMIGVAAELAGMHPQTLRIYERKKLVCPKRTAGSTRLYSDKDIETLKYIQELTQELGINLAGVKVILQLEQEREELKDRFGQIRREMQSIRQEMKEEIDKVHRQYKRELVVFPRGELMQRH
jgi:MerR family transcriptional regulator/heat shock protein HspR